MSDTMSAMSPQQYRPSRRSWIKLWVSEWLDGTVRWQLTQQQRAMWTDLLALAGYSRFPGYVTPGTDGDGLIGYPMQHLASVFRCSMAEASETLQVLENQGRITIDKNGVIKIVNWDKYQSEYQQKRQRTHYNKSAKGVRNVRNKSAKTPHQEVDVEVEGKKEIEAEAERQIAAFASISCEPFGPAKFRRAWMEEFESKSSGSWADAMERTIQRCKSRGINIPGRFFVHKREIEKVEAQNAYGRTPL